MLTKRKGTFAFAIQRKLYGRSLLRSSLSLPFLLFLILGADEYSNMILINSMGRFALLFSFRMKFVSIR